MKKWLFTVLFGSALVLGACGGGGDEGATDESGGDGGTDTEQSEGNNGGGTTDTAAAEEIFQNNCASCHGADLSGGAGPALTSIGADYSADEIAEIIKNGKSGGMPAFKGQIPKEDIQSLAQWLSQKK